MGRRNDTALARATPRPHSSTEMAPDNVAFPQVREPECVAGKSEAEGLIAPFAQGDHFVRPQRRLPELANLIEGASKEGTRGHGQPDRSRSVRRERLSMGRRHGLNEEIDSRRSRASLSQCRPLDATVAHSGTRWPPRKTDSRVVPPSWGDPRTPGIRAAT